MRAAKVESNALIDKIPVLPSYSKTLSVPVPTEYVVVVTAAALTYIVKLLLLSVVSA